MSTPETRLVDIYFNKYAESHQHNTNKLIHWICVPLFMFSLLGLVWVIPFPALAFLGKGQRYLNWGTLLIIFAMGYYLKLSFRLGVAMFLLIIIFSTVIVTLERMQRLHAWMPMRQVCLILFILSWGGQFIGYKIEGKKASFLDYLECLLIGPIWLWHFLFKKANLKY